MADEPNTVLDQLKLLNEKLTFNQKISMIAFGLVITATVIFFAFYINQDEYQTLYSNLNAEEAATVINRLKDVKVPYELADGGRTIQVPGHKLNELRIQLASEGLPQSGKIGFEIFDQTTLGMTEFLEKVNYKRALEGELSRTILSLQEVSKVRVHLVLPKESLFKQKSEPTKASVVVKLASGRQLSESMLSGIIHLVSSAVEGLHPESVTVVDVSGRLLSAKLGDSGQRMTTSQLELRSRVEKDMRNKIINILEPVVGDGRVKADASVVLNLTRSEATLEKYDPQETAVRSQQKSEERSTPVASPPAGVPGTQSNQAAPAPRFTPISGGASNALSKQSEVTNYEVTKLVRHTVDPYGDVKKISMAVIVDDALQLEKDPEGNVVTKTVSRTPEELTKIRDLVAATLGIDPERGDVLTVENIAFDTQGDFAEPEPSFFEKWQHLLRPLTKYLSLLLLFLLVYLLLIRPVKKRLFAQAEGVLARQPQQQGLEEPDQNAELSLESPRTVKELQASMQKDVNVLLGPADMKKSDIYRQRIVEFVQKQPESGAQVIRVWLNEESSS